MKHRILKLLVIIMAICCALCGCAKEEIDPEKYTSYKCYDYHLVALETEGKSARTEYSYYEREHLFEKTHVISKIANESDEQFIWAKQVVLLGSGYEAVMQNPDNYVDVFDDWSIKKIELYYPIKDDVSLSTKTKISPKVIASTSDAEILTHFKSFVDDCENRKFEKITGYRDEFLVQNVKVYIRVFFNESENIVWDANVVNYYSSENQDRIIQLDAGNETDQVSSPVRKFVSIDDQVLYDWISNATVNFDFSAYN